MSLLKLLPERFVFVVIGFVAIGQAASSPSSSVLNSAFARSIASACDALMSASSARSGSVLRVSISVIRASNKLLTIVVLLHPAVV